MQVHVFVKLSDEVDGLGNAYAVGSGMRLGKTITLPFPPEPGTAFHFRGDDVGFQFTVENLLLVEGKDSYPNGIKEPPWSEFEYLVYLRGITIPPGPIRDELIGGLEANGWERVFNKKVLQKAGELKSGLPRLQRDGSED